MAALLEQPRVAGMRVLQALQRRERLGHALQVAQGHGAHVEQVAVRRGVRQQAIGGCQRFAEAVLLDQLLYGGLHAGNDGRSTAAKKTGRRFTPPARIQVTRGQGLSKR